jgi:hypothetical protein
LTQPNFFSVTPKLYSVTPVWSNVETIFECLTALDNFVDELIICEGKWIGYEGELRSTDGTLDEIIRFIKVAKHPVTFMMLPEPMQQVDVRNLMIDHVPSQSLFIVIDSDEIVREYPAPDKLKELLKSDATGYCIRSYDILEKNNIDGHLMDLPKIWRKVDGLHYSRNHRYLDIYDTPVIYNTKDFPACKDFSFIHMSQKKTRQQSEAYKKFLLDWEYSDKFK